LPGGVLGDRFGRKRVMLISLAMFGAGSLACAYAPNAGAFIAARTVLGLSAGFMVPLVLSVVAVMFTDQERPKAVGIWAAANFLALPIGPILGGWLLSSYWWGWVFLMNLPVVAIGMVAVSVLVPESRAAERPGLDPAGIVASCAGLAALVYGFIAAGQYGWTSATAIAAMTAGGGHPVAFVAWERWLSRRPGGQPLVDLTLFKSARFTWGTILQAFGIFAMFGLLFAAPQFFQAILGASAMGSGLRLLPLMGGLALGAILAGRGARGLHTQPPGRLGFQVVARGLGPRHHHDRVQRKWVHRRVDRDRRGRLRPGPGHRRVRRPGGPAQGQRGGRVGGHAGGAEGGRPAVGRGPGQRPDLRLPLRAQPGGPAPAPPGPAPPQRLRPPP